MSSKLMQQLKEVERLATSGKFSRAWYQPFRYFHAQLFLKYTYPKTRKGIFRNAETFFGRQMQLLLPAATDIYLTGGKTHDSEIRLARYMIRHIRQGDTVMDIGAHFGYYTLLAAELVGKAGKVYAFEAAANTFSILRNNTTGLPQVQVKHNAMSGKAEEITFYEFPVLYSEYNSMDVEQFRGEEWMQEYQPTATKVQAIVLDEFVAEQNIKPSFIKIDVEGAEDKVIGGAVKVLEEKSPVIVMEFLSGDKQNAPHHAAAKQLQAKGYQPYGIDANGELSALSDISAYFGKHQVDSDNIVFKKK